MYRNTFRISQSYEHSNYKSKIYILINICVYTEQNNQPTYCIQQIHDLKYDI